MRKLIGFVARGLPALRCATSVVQSHERKGDIVTGSVPIIKRPSLGHKWVADADHDNMECAYCMCRPYNDEAERPCPDSPKEEGDE